MFMNFFLEPGHASMSKASKAHLVWQSGIGREMQRKGSNVLLCFRQWGHVSEDLRKKNHAIKKKKNQLY